MRLTERDPPRILTIMSISVILIIEILTLEFYGFFWNSIVFYGILWYFCMVFYGISVYGFYSDEYRTRRVSTTTLLLIWNPNLEILTRKKRHPSLHRRIWRSIMNECYHLKQFSIG